MGWIERQPTWLACLTWTLVLLVPSALFRFVVLPLALERDDPIGNVFVLAALAVPAIGIAAWMAYLTSCRVADRLGFGPGHLAFWCSLGLGLALYVVAW